MNISGTRVPPMLTMQGIAIQRISYSTANPEYAFYVGFLIHEVCHNELH